MFVSIIYTGDMVEVRCVFERGIIPVELAQPSSDKVSISVVQVVYETATRLYL